MPELIEFLESQSISSSGGLASATRVFHAIGYTTSASVYKLIKNGLVVGSVQMPKLGDAFPDLKGLKATDFSMSLVSDQGDVWRVEWQYQQNGADPESDGGKIGDLNGRLSGMPGHVEIGQDIRSEFVPAYRVGVTYPNSGDGTIIYPATQEVGGFSIDQAGTPVSVQRRMVDIVITELMTTEDANSKTQTWKGKRFKRNQDPFLDRQYARGSVLYKGATIRRAGEGLVTVTHQFTQDGDFHLQQIARQDQDGEATLNDEYRADFVYWVQPFNQTTNFNNISDNFA